MYLNRTTRFRIKEAKYSKRLESGLYLSLDIPELKCAAEEVEGPAAAELVKEELCESEEDSLVEEDFDLKENSFLLTKTQGHTAAI